MNNIQFSIIICVLFIILCNGQDQDIEDNGTITCYHCQSDENLDCLENVENFENSNVDCISGCAIGIIDGILYRNCQSSFDNRENIENILICNTTLCNNQSVKVAASVELKVQENEILEITEIPENNENKEEKILENNEVLSESEVENDKKIKIKCYKCEGQDENCLKQQSENNFVVCSDAGCYTKKSENILKRGCVSELNPDENKNCTNSESCNLCTVSECNNEAWSKCYSCRSSEDPNCAQWKQPEKSNIEICDNPNDNCVIEIESEIVTVRKCSQNNCENKEHCTSCSGSLCNSGVYPKNRQLCHQCSLTEECGEEQLPENMEICVNYNKNDGCFMFATSDPNLKVLMHRGCKSDVIKYSECQKTEADKRCLTCDTGNGCNSQGARTKPKLWCSTCDMSEKCAWSQTQSTAKKCIENYWYTLKETCFIYSNENATAERGCSFDRGVCIDDPKCKTCDKSGCNFGTTIHQSCIQCNSSRIYEIQCRKDLTGIVGKKCNRAEIHFDDIGCYTKINGKHVIRGCIADLDAKALQNCKEDKDCYFCKEQDCNSKPVFSHAIIIQSKFVNYILLVVLFLGKVFNEYI